MQRYTVSNALFIAILDATVIEKFLALYVSPIDGKQPTCVSKSRNDIMMERVKISLILLL